MTKHIMRKILLLATVMLPGLAAMAQPKLSENPIHEVVEAMTLQEKASLVVGVGLNTAIPDAVGQINSVERLGVPYVMLADGPAGLRIKPERDGQERTFHCTSFPVGTAMSSTWNPELAFEVGDAMGGEVRDYGIDVILGPALNIQRNPLCGRNFEYYSEDPFLTGLIGAAVVDGIESNDVGACIKHFAANSQETNRVWNDSRVPVRALREIYLKGFEIAVRKSQPWMLMSSYNMLNGQYTSVNRGLMHDVLRCEWGFEGVAVTDWGFNGTPPPAQIMAENDLLMEGCPEQVQLIVSAVESGELPESQLDICVKRILGLARKSCRYRGYEYSEMPDLQASAQVALKAAHESIVMLENNGALPFDADVRNVALFGNASYDFLEGGTGSGEVHEPYIISPADGFVNRGYTVNQAVNAAYRSYIKDAADADFAKNGARHWFFGRFHPSEMDVDVKMIRKAARESDIAVITISRQAGEAGDRYARKGDFELSDKERLLVENVSAAFHARNKKVVVLLNVGSPLEVASWRNIPDAVLVTWQCGQEGGNAIADVLSGKVSPSGKLPATFPVRYQDVPSADNYPAEDRHRGKDGEKVRNVDYTEYAEGIYVGYRHFDRNEVPVCYPFGYGLSYTTFVYDNLSIVKDGYDYKVCVDVRNTGERPGKEAVQVYVSAPAGGLDKPVKELKSFAKTPLLQPGESCTVEMQFSTYDLASFDESRCAWVADNGVYKVMAGSSSQDIRLEGELDVISEMSWPVHDVLKPVK